MLIRHAKPRIKPPGNLVMRLRRGHPLADEARLVVLMGGQFGLGRDLVSGAPFVGTNTPTIALNQEGPTLDVSGTAYIGSPHQPDWAVLGEITVAWRGLIRNPGSLGNLICKIPFAGGGGANTPFSLEVSNPTANAVSFGRSNSNYRVWQSGTAPLASTAVSSISVSQPATIETAPIFYFDGVQDSVAAANQYGGAGSGSPTDTGSDVQIGRRPDGAEQLDGQPLIAIVSAMQWAADQHLRFALDPYSVLEEAPRYYYASPPTSGVTVALTGVAGTGAVGTLGPQTAVAASGVAATGAVGTVVPSLALALTGVEGLAAVGDVGIGGDKTVALTGVDATGEVGDVAVAVPSGAAGPSRTRRGARRVYLPEPQASAVFHPNALPEDLAPHAVKAWQDDEDDETWFLLA